MAATPSSRAIRLRELKSTFTPENLQKLANDINKSKDKKFDTTLAAQEGSKTATITFSADEKKKIDKRKFPLVDGVLDDQSEQFHNLTVLCCPPDADVDICAVHGLNGNAFDTWMTENGRVWLRDLLPSSLPFEKARIMIYGYDSLLMSSGAVRDRLQDYSDNLLDQIKWLRDTDREKKRPIIFICHSMGGLVARLAMTRLHTLPTKFPFLDLKQCGLLFLSTPHSGATAADWNKFVVSLGESFLGVRRELVTNLESFNPAEVDSIDIFNEMKVKPVYECLCESEQTRTSVGKKYIVSQSSAGFMEKTAIKVPHTDHHTICKFDNALGAYKYVLDCLKKIRTELALRNAETEAGGNTFPIPGRPEVTAHSFPLAAHQKHFLGFGHFGERQFVGRKHLIDQIEDKLKQRSSPISLVGIGGIGKTEILLEVASRHQNQQHVFFLPASTPFAFKDAIHDITQIIGHDFLHGWHSYPDAHRIWTKLKEYEQALAFKTWLLATENADSIIILDDLAGMEHHSHVQNLVPLAHKSIIYSTRDPTLAMSWQLRGAPPLIVSNMEQVEMYSLIEAEMVCNGLEASEDEVMEIARIVDGHPLAACRAVSFIAQQLSWEPFEDSPARTFINRFRNQEWETRGNFLEYGPHCPSIYKVFETSLLRLDPKTATEARQLLDAAAFLCGADQLLDFRKFFSTKRPWMLNLKTDIQFDDILVSTATHTGSLWNLLGELAKVSLVSRRDMKSVPRLHPIWLECIRQRCRPEGRKRWLQQILTICYETSVRDQEASSDMHLYAENCLDIAWRFAIQLDDLAVSEHVRTWLGRGVGDNKGKSAPHDIGLPEQKRALAMSASICEEDEMKGAWKKRKLEIR